MALSFLNTDGCNLDLAVLRVGFLPDVPQGVALVLVIFGSFTEKENTSLVTHDLC